MGRPFLSNEFIHHPTHSPTPSSPAPSPHLDQPQKWSPLNAFDPDQLPLIDDLFIPFPTPSPSPSPSPSPTPGTRVAYTVFISGNTMDNVTLQEVEYLARNGLIPSVRHEIPAQSDNALTAPAIPDPDARLNATATPLGEEAPAAQDTVMQDDPTEDEADEAHIDIDIDVDSQDGDSDADTDLDFDPNYLFVDDDDQDSALDLSSSVFSSTSSSSSSSVASSSPDALYAMITSPDSTSFDTNTPRVFPSRAGPPTTVPDVRIMLNLLPVHLPVH